MNDQGQWFLSASAHEQTVSREGPWWLYWHLHGVSTCELCVRLWGLWTENGLHLKMAERKLRRIVYDVGEWCTIQVSLAVVLYWNTAMLFSFVLSRFLPFQELAGSWQEPRRLRVHKCCLKLDLARLSSHCETFWHPSLPIGSPLVSERIFWSNQPQLIQLTQPEPLQ